MSDLFNPITRSLPGAATGPTVVSGVIADPPRSLLGLITGTILKGTVVGKGADGLTTIATDKGTVSVATNAALPAGSAVTLEVRNAGGDRLQVLILAVETAAARNNAASQSTSSGHAGGANTAATASGAAAGAARKADAKPAARPTGPPTIEIAGSSVKAIVVQTPAAASLLPTPDVEIEPFTPPSPPISTPPDAAQKAQILAQARAMIEPQTAPAQTVTTSSSTTTPTTAPNPVPTGTTPTGNLPTSGQATTLPLNLLPTGTPIAADVSLLLASGAPPPSGTPSNPVVLPEPGVPLQIGGTALQPEVAARIAALFAAANASEPVPSNAGGEAGPPGSPAATVPAGAPPTSNVPPGAAPTPTPIGALPTGAVNPLPPGSLPAANVPPGTMPASLGPAASPLLAQILGTASPAAAPGPAVPLLLPAGSELTLHVVAVLPTKGGEIEFAPEAAHLTGGAAPIIGKVLGYTRAGFAVIDTPNGALMMQERARLPVGAQVALVLEPRATPVAAPLPPITNPQQALLSLSSGWPTLDDVLAVLRASGATPDDGAPPPPPGIPQTGPRLAAGLAGAISAFRNGDLEKLLGPMLAARKLPIEKEEMGKRLKEEFTQLSDLGKDRPAVDWRAFFLPIYDERIGLTQINLYYRHNTGGGTGDDKDKKDQGTRFLVDVNFAALGAFQLDGLIRGKRFDLMIRSRRRLSRNQRQEIIGIFDNALEVGGAKGALEFRTVEAFPVSPLDELRQSHDHLTA